MYCPRCGSQNSDTTKFCRQCGLPVNPIADYVASGGTAPLAPSRVTKAVEGFTPKQQLVLTIMLFVFLPAVFGVIGKAAGLQELAGIPSVLMPFGIVWAIFRYRNQLRRMHLQQMYQQMSPAQPQYHPIPQARPNPELQAQPYQPQVSPPPTNPIAQPINGSVTEDETQRLPGQER